MQEDKNKTKDTKVTKKTYPKLTVKEYCGMKGLDSFNTAFVSKMFSGQTKTEIEWEKSLKSKINLR